ncbi:hypothetical protein F4561_002627 [Lipingzhangella halophila]|uniref:Uncharacterized protein n=1 Tax=Lipingzhangella halophila TaxID=1783352 RepID=A0A7W7RH73_9ACTN|nr:hypothetical protein [Lipingzhangella halophila]MBB4931807.1 hypothetical protein [Lipingzhangella halophila]
MADFDDYHSLVPDPVTQTLAHEFAASVNPAVVTDASGRPLPGFAQAARFDYRRRGGDRDVTETGVARALLTLIADIRTESE